MSDKPRFEAVKEKDGTWSVYTQIGVAYCRISGPHTGRTARLFAEAEEMAEMLRELQYHRKSPVMKSDHPLHFQCPTCGGCKSEGQHRTGCKLAALLARIEVE